MVLKSYFLHHYTTKKKRKKEACSSGAKGKNFTFITTMQNYIWLCIVAESEKTNKNFIKFLSLLSLKKIFSLSFFFSLSGFSSFFLFPSHFFFSLPHLLFALPICFRSSSSSLICLGFVFIADLHLHLHRPRRCPTPLTHLAQSSISPLNQCRQA